MSPAPKIDTEPTVEQSIELCLITQDAGLIEATQKAALGAGVTFSSMPGCSSCHVPCKAIVAVDIANPLSTNAVSHAHRKNGGNALIAIASESMTPQELKQQGFQFVVSPPLLERFLPAILRIASSLVAPRHNQ